jgi:hypothetical protein
LTIKLGRITTFQERILLLKPAIDRFLTLSGLTQIAMDLHQLQLTYQVEDDRIILRISFKETESLQEIRAWLTRRLVKNLWSGIIRALETRVSLAQPLAAHASAEIVNMEHQASVSEIRSNGSFDTPFEAAADDFPMGETPILVTAAHFTIHPDQPLRVNFTNADNHGFEIAFTQTVLHGFCSLLQEAVTAAEWDLELRLPGIGDTGTASRTLN